MIPANQHKVLFTEGYLPDQVGINFVQLATFEVHVKNLNYYSISMRL